MLKRDFLSTRIRLLVILGALGAGLAPALMLGVMPRDDGSKPDALLVGGVAAGASALASAAMGALLLDRARHMLRTACKEIESIFPDDTPGPSPCALRGASLEMLSDCTDRLRNRIKGQDGVEAITARRESREKLRQEEMQDKISLFRVEVDELLATTAAELKDNQRFAASVASAAEHVSKKAKEAAEASQKSSSEVEAVSTAADNVATANAMITERAQRARSFASDTRAVSDRGKEQMLELQEQAGRITGVMEIIRSIARKTNLLALNASIEAARAGAAGKGFAVVANEVKNLAEQTTSATGEIAEIIEGMQNSAERAGVSFTEALSALTEIEELVVSIAEAVTEQDLAVSDISFAIMGAASSASVCAYDISQLAHAVTEASESAVAIGTASNNIFAASTHLSNTVVTFLNAVCSDLDERRSSLRVASNETIQLEMHGRTLAGRLINLSQTGAQIFTDVQFAPNEELVLSLPGGNRARGRIVWSNMRSYGVQFTESENAEARAAFG